MRDWWDDKKFIEVDGKDKAKFFSIDELAAMNYDFDKCCPFPHTDEEIFAPEDIIENFLAERADIQSEVADVLAEIQNKLKGINFNDC